jgi:hypothetical protein
VWYSYWAPESALPVFISHYAMDQNWGSHVHVLIDPILLIIPICCDKWMCSKGALDFVPSDGPKGFFIQGKDFLTGCQSTHSLHWSGNLKMPRPAKFSGTVNGTGKEEFPPLKRKISCLAINKWNMVGSFTKDEIVPRHIFHDYKLH